MVAFQDVTQNPANKVSEQPKDYESGGQVKFGGQVNALMTDKVLAEGRALQITQWMSQ